MILSVINEGLAEHYTWGNNCEGSHLIKTNNLSVIQQRMLPNSTETSHYHTKAEQFFFILSGIGTMAFNKCVFTIPTNSGIYKPAGSKHRLSNQHNTDLVFTVTSTPPSHGDRIEIK